MPAKRKENKIRKDNITTQLYNFYKKSSKNPVSREVYVKFLFGDDSNICSSLGLYPTIIRKIVEENFMWKMPCNFGVLSLVKYKKELVDKDGNIKAPRNYQEEWKLWRRKYPNISDEDIAKIPNKPKVYYDLEDTNGYKFTFKWDKRGCNITNNSAYKLKMQRAWEYFISKRLKDPNFKTDYYLL